MTNTHPTAVGVLRYWASVEEGARSDMPAALLTCADLEDVSLEQIVEIDEPQPRPTKTRTEDSDPLQAIGASAEAVALLVVGDLNAPVLDLIRRRELRVITIALPRNESAGEEATADAIGTRHVEIDLLNGRGWRVGTLTIAVRGRVVSMRYAGVPVGVMDRDRLRGWLNHPRRVLAVDGIAWSSQGGAVQVSVKDSMPYSIPAAAVDELLAVI